MINNKLAFLDVIKVIEKSSKAELQAIARVEKAIVKSGVARVVAETEKPRQSRRIDPRLGRAPRVEEPTTSSVSSDYAPAGSGSPMHQDTTSDPGEVVDENQATQENNIVVVVPEAKPNDAQKVESETASSSSVIDAPSVNVDTTVDNSAITDALEAQARAQTRQASESARTNSLLDGIYRDQRGDIRQRSGAFATRQQKEMFEKQERTKANEENPEQNSLLRTISTWASNKMDNAAANSAVDAGGMAVGGSLWLAAKEVNDLAKDAESFLAENNLTSVEGVKAKAAETKEKAIKAKDAALNPIQAAKRLLGRESSSSTTSDSHSSSSSESAQSTESSQSSAEVVNTQSSATTTESERVESVESSQSGLSASDVRSRNNEPDNVDLVDALASQSEAQKEAAEDHGKKLDDIKKAIAASRGGEGGLSDMVDTDRKKRKGRKNKRGRKRGRNGRNVKPRRTPRAMSSVMETSGKSIGGKLAGSAATKGAGMAARGALRAVPLLGTLAMTAFDAVDGFTNEGKQREAFNVKDGDEVTTGQKSSMALANVLDMGGLVSGGLGLLGGGLESIGISGAAEALSFNSSDMARGIYDFFGGED